MGSRIEWCDETLNPLGHGCYGPGGTAEKPNVCPYCYALRMAKRGMGDCPLCKAFKPHPHFERLEQLQHWKKPRNIFMQSMGDLFGDWVEEDWLLRIFCACISAPQHRYLFLSKNPGMYNKLIDTGMLPCKGYPNWWFGITCTTQAMLEGLADMPMECNRFISFEPLQEPIEMHLRRIQVAVPFADWVIIGAETGPGAEARRPRREWVEDIVGYSRDRGVPVFLTDNLVDVWGRELIQELPAGLRKVADDHAKG
jgi:protein gp37